MSGELWLYFTVTCVTPGTGVLYTLTNAFRYGRSRAYLSPIGNMLGCAVMSVVSAAGLGAVITASPVLFTTLEIAGALVLAWMGWKSWRARPLNLAKLGQMNASATDHKNTVGILTNAALLQLTNPMLIVFLLSLMPPFVHPENDYAARMALLIGIFLLTVLSVHLLYSYTAAFIAEHVQGERFSAVLNKTSAVLFWLCTALVISKVLA